MGKFGGIPNITIFNENFKGSVGKWGRLILSARASILFLSLGMAMFLLIFTGCSDNLYEEEEREPTQVIVTEKNVEEVPVIVVEIKGEVLRPGVYSIQADRRLNDLVILAGGKTQNAELRHINLAKKLKDGDSFYIPFIGEPAGSGSSSGSGYSTGNGTSGSEEEKGKIDLNEATREELMTVPGIGPATADNILRYRESAGGFKNIEDLLEVDRIGDKTLEKLKEYLEVR